MSLISAHADSSQGVYGFIHVQYGLCRLGGGGRSNTSPAPAQEEGPTAVGSSF